MPSTLDAIADPVGRFAVLAMDQRGTLRRMLTGAGRPAADVDLSTFKVDVVSALGPQCTGALLDVEYGVAAVRASGSLPAGVGLLIAAEPADRASWNGEPRVAAAPGRNAAWVRANTGDALKFLLQWRPDRVPAQGEPDLLQEALDVVRQVVGDCRSAGMASVIEPLVVAPPGQRLSPPRHAELVLQSATRLAELGPDLLKLEWPGDAAGCRRVSSGLGRVPWALLSAGVAFEEFTQRVRIALDEGASGFIAGRAIWGEAVTLVGDERRTFLRDVAAGRLRELVALLPGRGRSWRRVAGC